MNDDAKTTLYAFNNSPKESRFSSTGDDVVMYIDAYFVFFGASLANAKLFRTAILSVTPQKAKINLAFLGEH